MSELEIQAQKEKMFAYGQMMDTWAWKDLSNFLERLRASTVRDFVNFGEKDAVELRIGEYKGMLQCLNRIDQFLKEATLNP